MHLALLLPLFAACSGDKAGGSPADSPVDTGPVEGPGDLMLSFAMEEDLIASMDEEPIGTFRGSVFAEEDATAVGPVEGAEPLVSFTAEGLDLTGGGPAEDALLIEDLDSGIVWVLGCLDSDDNGCDTADPITIPNENKVIVVAYEQTDLEVFMSMLRPDDQ